jgi:DNA-binding MarR family transcriptional regulator/GNAT superfamily N-acetyltransferase
MLAQQDVEAVRRFNRTVTRRVGALDESFMGRGRPLGEARLLYEIGPQGADVRDLRARLSLDSGYLSRTLRSLERQGLVASRRADHDARVTSAALTPTGVQEVAELDKCSDAFAAGLLTRLGEEQRARLVTAMREVERLMQAAAIEIALAPARGEAARWCIAQYFAEIDQRFPGGFDPAKSRPLGFDAMTPPAGYFYLATLDGRPVGCGVLTVLDEQTGYIKRVWVARETRGMGLGRRMMETLEMQARSLGMREVRLDTHDVLTEAQTLYRSIGYREVPPFNDEPYSQHWFVKDIAPPDDRIDSSNASA